MPTGGRTIDLSTRISATFGPSTIFSPGLPPVPPEPRPVRPFDLNPGQNLQYVPRGYEPFGFASLRAFANQELVRLAIETRKDQVEDYEWLVRPKGRHRRPENDPQMLARIFAVESFLAKPDGVRPFASWLRMLLEDVLAIDAPAIEKRRNFKGELVGLDIVQGDTIKLLVDDDGRIPLPPAPAYQQIIRGRVWNDLTTEDMIYAPRNLRPGHIYGFSPVEQIIVTINTAIGRQTQQLAYFTEGNVPAGFITVPEGWTAEQIREWQDWMDARLAGNQAERAKLIWAPFGAKYQSFKDAPLKDDYDEWLARIVCFCFSLPPTAFVHQVNRATANSEQDRARDEGIEPLLKWVARLMSGVIQEDLGHQDLEFAWDLATKPDQEAAEVYDLWLAKGVATIDEVRDQFNRDPLPNGLGSQPLIYHANGVISLKQALETPLPVSDVNAVTAAKAIRKSKKQTLYISRTLTNAQDIIAWAKGQGLEITLPADAMHVTIAYSKTKLDWDALSTQPLNLSAPASDDRALHLFGPDKNVLVLGFEMQELRDRWQEVLDCGGSWDWPDYQPHVTITYQSNDIDPALIKPYSGNLEFGPEIFAEVDEGWKDNISEKAVS